MPAGNRASGLRFLLLLAFIALFAVIGRLFNIDAAALQDYLKKFPVFYSGAIFVVIYAVVTFFAWFSKDIFRFIAASLFGAYLSTLFVFAAEIVNAFILFYFARYLGSDFTQRYLGNREDNFDEKLARVNFLWLFLFRAVPLVPFRFLDLGCGLTKISFRRYLAVVILGSPLRIFWVQYALANIGEAVFKNPYALSARIYADRGLFVFSLIYFILVIVVAIKLKRKD